MTQRKATARAAPPAPAPAPAPTPTSAGVRLSALRVSSPSDPAEKEADSTAKKIMRMPAPEAAAPRQLVSPYAARFEEATTLVRTAPLVARQADGRPDASANVKAEIAAARASGNPLPLSVRRFMEPRFRADFSGVRMHTGDRAAQLSNQLGARAFAVSNQIFFGKDRFKPETDDGKELIAHELTHTIQQGGAIQRSEDVTVTQQSPVQVQRFSLVDEAIDFVAKRVDSIPGFPLLTLALGKHPLTGAKVDRTPANVIRGLISLVPGGSDISQALDNHGIIDKVGNFVSQQIDSLGLAADSIKTAVVAFARDFSVTEALTSPGKVWDRAKRLFTDPWDQIKNFVRGLAGGILTLIKDLILKPLAAFVATQFPDAWNLLKAILEKDPLTGDPYPRNVETLLGGLLKLAGKDEIWQRIQETKAIAKIKTWFTTNVQQLVMFVKQIPSLFVTAFKSLVIVDIVLLPRAFAKLASVFGGFAGQFISWVGTAAWNLLEIIFSVVSPGAWSHIQKTGAALKSILQNPIPFVGNLAKAAKLGFQNFAANFGSHLKNGLIDWLTGSLQGVYIPKAFSIAEIIKFVFSVLGISWGNIRQKLVKAVGEPAVKAMEVGFDIVVTLVTKGPAAAWDKIKEQLANLKDMIISGLIDMAIEAVVTKAVPKLIAMFIPGAGFVSAIMSVYDIVMVFVQKIAKIIAVVNAFVNSIVAIAAGQIGAAAGKVESILGGLLSLAISFLMQFAGLGKVADKIMGVINKVRAMVDKGIDWLIKFIVTGAKNFLSKVVTKSGKPEENLQQALAAAQSAVSRFSGKKVGAVVLNPLLAAIRLRYGLSVLEVVPEGNRWAVRGVINPTGKVTTDALTETAEGDLTEQELMNMLMGQVTPIVETPPAGTVEDVPGKPGETRPVGPTTTISVSSLGLSEEILYYYIDVSPATDERKRSVSRGVAGKIAAAQTAKDSHDIYKALQQAGGMVNSLYPEGGKVVVVHHEQRVSESPETFPRTQEERVRIPVAIQKQMQASIATIQKKYKAMKNMPLQEKRRMAEADIAELVKLVKQSLLDWKLTRERDAKGKRTKEGTQATAGDVPLDEIDLIAGSRRGHITVHQKSGR